MDLAKIIDNFEKTKNKQIIILSNFLTVSLILNMFCLVAYIYQEVQIEQRNGLEIFVISLTLVVPVIFMVRNYRTIQYYTNIVSTLLVKTFHYLVGL